MVWMYFAVCGYLLCVLPGSARDRWVADFVRPVIADVLLV